MYKSKALLSIVFLLLLACTEKEPALHLLDGSNVKLSQLQGKLVLINYWAEWCKPCREEVQALNDFARDNAEKVAVYAVNFDGVTGDRLKAQIKSIGITFPVLEQDPRELFGVSSSGVLPETLVVDQRGNFQQVLLGPQTEHKLNMLLSSFTEEMHYNG